MLPLGPSPEPDAIALNILNEGAVLATVLVVLATALASPLLTQRSAQEDGRLVQAYLGLLAAGGGVAAAASPAGLCELMQRAQLDAKARGPQGRRVGAARRGGEERGSAKVRSSATRGEARSCRCFGSARATFALRPRGAPGWIRRVEAFARLRAAAAAKVSGIAMQRSTGGQQRRCLSAVRQTAARGLRSARSPTCCAAP